jgi:hypothetical protein
MSYVDYTYYQNDYHGTAITDADEFASAAASAARRIDLLTRDRARKNVTGWVKLANCAMAEACRRQEARGAKLDETGAPVASEKVGDWSVSYAVQAEDMSAAGRIKALNDAMDAAGLPYLALTGLLYGGVPIVC